ncbi:MAG: hypothetical protein R6U96_05620 [Promethearchaeia archaeon]
MNLEHIAVASNSEKNSDNFFVNLLEMKKVRSFDISPDLTEKIFGVKKKRRAIRYESEHINAEVFITDENEKARDIFTHNCLLVKDPDRLLSRANAMDFDIKKIPRQGEGFYYFIKDAYDNLYEIKILK